MILHDSTQRQTVSEGWVVYAGMHKVLSIVRTLRRHHKKELRTVLEKYYTCISCSIFATFSPGHAFVTCASAPHIPSTHGARTGFYSRCSLVPSHVRPLALHVLLRRHVHERAVLGIHRSPAVLAHECAEPCPFVCAALSTHPPPASTTRPRRRILTASVNTRPPSVMGNNSHPSQH